MLRPLSLLALAALALPSTALAQDLTARIDAAVEHHAADVVKLRHRIHQNPELGNREVETARLVAEHLRALGFDEVRTGVAHTGVVGILKGGKPGPVVAVRADMDALPVTEATPFPFKSTVRTTYLGQDVGVSHACGHDIHTAVQLGLASTLASVREDLPGTVMFLFQPAEEGAPPGEEGGAELMLEEGVFKAMRPAAVFGLHVYDQLPVGTLGYTPGPAMAASDRWTATIRGQQSHGAAPHMGIDPVVIASQAVLALQTIRSRNMDPLDPGVVTVGIIRGGERNNIIPMEVYLEGTVRTFDPKVQDMVERRMREILEATALAGGATVEFSYNRGYPVTVNDIDLSTRSSPVLARVKGVDEVRQMRPVTGAEDFSFFANEVPGFYFWLGGLKPGTQSGGHHTPTFMVDDASIPIGMRAMASLVVDYLTAPR